MGNPKSLSEGMTPQTKAADSAAAKQVMRTFATKPALFVENVGQCADTSVRFAHQGTGANALIGDDGICLQLLGENSRTVWMRFPGADKVRPIGVGLAKTKFNYHVGADPTKWIDGAPCYESVVYHNLYPGIDLVVRGLRSNLKYDFHVAVGADYRRIQIRYDGIEKLRLNADGALEAQLSNGTSSVVDEKPIAYQVINGQKEAVAIRFRLLNSSTCAFETQSTVSPDHALIIDPKLMWFVRLGKAYDYFESGSGVATDSCGNCYVTGDTHSANWTTGGFDTTYNGGGDVFAAKFSSDGNMLWSTYLGGKNEEAGCGVAVDASGNCYVAGETKSPGWVSGGYHTTFSGDDGFIVKLSSDGCHIWSTYITGNRFSYTSDIAADGSGNCYVVGYTSARGWISGGYDTTFNGGYRDGFVVKVSSSGRRLWSTYLGGNNDDAAEAAATDASGNCYVTGWTYSSGWVKGGYDITYNRGGDAFVVKVSSNGHHLWSTYLGGKNADEGSGITIDRAGNCYAVGLTDSPGWVRGGFDTRFVYDDPEVEDEPYVAELSSSGRLFWSTYLGYDPNGYLGCGEVCTDPSGDCYVSGEYNFAEEPFPAKISKTGKKLKWNLTFDDDPILRSLGWISGLAIDDSYNCYFTGKAFAANFKAGPCLGLFNVAPHQLDVQSTPVTGVAITGSPAGTTNYSQLLEDNTPVTLTAAATASNEYVFDHWTVNGTDESAGQLALSFNIGEPTTAVAAYAEKPRLAVTSSPLTGVSITGTSAGTTNYSAELDVNTQVTLTAPATAVDDHGDQYVFKGWSYNGGAFTKPDKYSISFSFQTTSTATAIYTLRPRLTVKSAPITGVKITGWPPGVTNYSRVMNDYTYYTLKASASAAGGYVFVRWINDGVSRTPGQNSGAFFIDHSQTDTALYKRFGYMKITGPSSIAGGAGYAQYRCDLFCKDGSHYNITYYATWSDNSAYAHFWYPGFLLPSAVPSDQHVRITAKYAGHTCSKYITIKHR